MSLQYFLKLPNWTEVKGPSFSFTWCSAPLSFSSVHHLSAALTETNISSQTLQNNGKNKWVFPFMSVVLNTAVHAYFSVVIPEYLKGTCPSSHYGLFIRWCMRGKEQISALETETVQSFWLYLLWIKFFFFLKQHWFISIFIFNSFNSKYRPVILYHLLLSSIQ